jgi:uncharacterized protein (DUF302 family)
VPGEEHFAMRMDDFKREAPKRIPRALVKHEMKLSYSEKEVEKDVRKRGVHVVVEIDAAKVRRRKGYGKYRKA